MYLQEKVNEVLVCLADCYLGVETWNYVWMCCLQFNVLTKRVGYVIALVLKLPFYKVPIMLQKLGPRGQSLKETDFILNSLQKRGAKMKYQGVICL